MKKSLYPVLLVSLLVVSFAFIYGCGSNPAGGGGAASSGRIYYGVTSRGDTVKVTLTDKTFNFNLVHGPDGNLTVSGSLTLCASGLLSAEVKSSTNTGAVDIGSMFNGIEVTGEMLALGGGDNPSIMICPALTSTKPIAGTYEIVMIGGPSWEPDGRMGCASMEIFMVPPISFEATLYDILNNWVDRDIKTGYTFTDHLFRNISSPEIFNSPKGLIAGIHGGGDYGSFVGTARDESVTIAGLCSVITYEGMRYSITFPTATSNDTDLQSLIATTETSSGSIFITSMDAVTGSPEGDAIATITLNNIDNIAPGIIEGTLESDGDFWPVQMVAYKYNTAGKYILTGICTTDSDAINFFIVEQ